jgi:hypothetical protein
MNAEQGKAFYESHLGIRKNTGAGVERLESTYNQNLRNKPKSAEQNHLERQNKLLRAKLERLEKGKQ